MVLLIIFVVWVVSPLVGVVCWHCVYFVYLTLWWGFMVTCGLFAFVA